MQNNRKKHICKWNKIRDRYQRGGFIIMIHIPGCAFINLYTYIKIKKNKLQEAKIFKCNFCKEYKWVCPYCQTETIMTEVPRFYKCEICGNESYFDPYFAGFINILQNGKKP